MSQDAAQEHYDKQRRSQYHGANLQGGEQHPGETTQILNTLSEIEDLPIDPEDDAVMGQLISRLTSTANLSEEEVRSNEWVREYILILYLCKYPTPDGCHSSWRGWAHGNADEEIEPLSPSTRMELETLVTSSKLALSRSQGAKVIEEGTRNVNESIVSEQDDEGKGSGGLLGRLTG